MSFPQLPAFVPEVKIRPDVGCAQVTTDLRGAATATTDVSTWTRDRGVPEGWEGDDAAAADHAMTLFSGRTDEVSAALTEVTTACDTFAETVVTLDHDRVEIEADRKELNGALYGLSQEIRHMTEDQEPDLRARALVLIEREAALQGRITALEKGVVAAEDALVRAFQRADTSQEAADLAADPGRPDVDALYRQFGKHVTEGGSVTAWWLSLTKAEREALKIDNPGFVGNLNGIPAGDRDEANRSALERDLDRLTSLQQRGETLTKEEQALLAKAKATREALDDGLTVTDPSTGQPVDTNLLVYDPSQFGGDGAVAVSYGDPDTADHTTVIVPGITNDMTSIPGVGEDALNLFREASKQDQGSVATIAWIGYDAPSMHIPEELTDTPDNVYEVPSYIRDLPEGIRDLPGELFDMGSVSQEDAAEDGGRRLSDFVDGLRATDQGEQSHLTVAGHSYGSTTAAHAAHDGLDADALVLLGSPGASGDVDDVTDLNMPDGKVYVASADNDFVTWLGREGDLGMGPDPAQADFGATRIDTDDGEDFHLETMDRGLENHTSYFDRESDSLEGLAKVSTGQEPDTRPGRTTDANDMLLDWGKDEVAYQAGKVEDGLRDGAHEAFEKGKDLYEAGKDVVTDPIGTAKDLLG